MYITVKLLIREEEDYLARKFGEEYQEYKAKVNAVFPRIWKLYRIHWYPEDSGLVGENVYAVQVKDANMFLYVDDEHAIAFDASCPGRALQDELGRLSLDPEVDDRVLFGGDTQVLRNGQFDPFYRLLNMDTAVQRESIRRLARLQGVELLCTAHTGCTMDVTRAMKPWRRRKA